VWRALCKKVTLSIELRYAELYEIQNVLEAFCPSIIRIRDMILGGIISPVCQQGDLLSSLSGGG